MLTHLLAAHPDTPAETLTHLASIPGLSPATRLALHTHPNTPPAAYAHLGEPAGDELHALLTHPDTSAHRRAAILTAAHSRGPQSALWVNIAEHTDLTGPEIRAAVAAHPITRRSCATAIARNPNTPADLARASLEHLATTYLRTATHAGRVTLIAAAERHHYDLTHLGALAAPHAATTFSEHLAGYLTAHATTGATYAQHLLGTTPLDSPADWLDIIRATADPHHAAHALTHPKLTVCAGAIAGNSRLPQVRTQAILAGLSHTNRRGRDLATRALRDAHPTTTHEAVTLAIASWPGDGTRGTLLAITEVLALAAANPATRTDTLTLIAEARGPAYPATLGYAILAAHPNATPAQRAASRVSSAASTDPTHAALTAVARHLTAGDPRPARTIPAAALTTVHTHTAAPLVHHHARHTAYSHPHWPRTHTGALALLTLAHGFTGTLDQLLTAAHAVSR